ncbi:MAG: efflux RND transporter periplasmic adaptor subunit [candidate division NC10 bacterium]|nr:efflux RND transporter periplasmic adaptor subunit [candidate division NC10 bacterium]MDE2322728.1 efflux RND transporter periplasmic adaptor subunit [candidate division NC10 bacterium]
MRFRFLPLLLVTILCAACGDGSSTSPGTPAKPAPEPKSPDAAVETVKITSPEYRTRQQVLETTGKVQFNEERLVRVNAPVTGRASEVLAHPGDIVERGHRLLVLDSPDLGTAKSDYAKAASDLEHAEKAVTLARELFQVKAIAQKELRDTENDYRKAMVEEERSASRLRTLGVPDSQFNDIAARTDTSTTVVVTAPRGGVIVERNVIPGQVVAYGQSDTPPNLFLISDLSTMWVLADVYEPDVSKVRVGQTAGVTLACCPSERYEGQVTYISDSVDPQTRTVKVRVVVPNRGRALKAEMFVKVAILTGSARVLALPQSAVHREDGETFVLIARGKDEYDRREVKVGVDLDGAVEVLDGVTPQDRVVSTGSILLKKTAK